MIPTLEELVAKSTVDTVKDGGAMLEALAKTDAAQAEHMRQERVIVVDTKDVPVGTAHKGTAHFAANGLPLHRAFSVFWFNSDGNLLLQRRALEKATFPGYWTNTCCSHPLLRPDEYYPNSDLVRGIQNAAIRKLQHELGVDPNRIQPDALRYMTRIHYQALSDSGEWGEHELDYVFLLQHHDDVALNPSTEEVMDVKWVSPFELNEMFAAASRREIQVTPWFRAIAEAFLPRWWLILDTPEELDKAKDWETIHQVGDPCYCQRT